MEEDPEELTNLAVNPEYSKLLFQMRKRTAGEFRKRDGEFIELLPEPVNHQVPGSLYS